MAKRNLLSISSGEVRELFSYDPLRGELVWNHTKGRRVKGKVAGSIDRKTGYRVVTFRGIQYLAHRLIWVWFHGLNPKGEVDHVGQELSSTKKNHVWGLVDRTPRQHRQVTSLNIGRRALPQGVHLNPSGSYTAYTQFNSRQVNLGTFPDPEEALAARIGAEKIIETLSNS